MNPKKLPIKTLFRWRKHSWYSLAPLTAILERLDLPFEVVKDNFIQKIQQAIDEYYFPIYADSVLSFILKDSLTDISSVSESFNNRCLLIAGGPHASGDPVSLLDNKVDIIVNGEGEISLPLLIKFLQSNGFSKDSLSTVPGISFYDSSNKLLTTKKPDKINLDDYSPYSNHSSFPLHPPIEITRGCRFGCKFCQVPRLHGPPRFRSIPIIEKIVKHYIKQFQPYGRVDLRFITPNSLGYGEKERGQPNIQALKALLSMLSSYPVRVFFGTFPSEIRPEYINPDTIELLKDIDNFNLSVGFQSASDNILKIMNRGHDVETCLRAHELLVDNGFEPIFDYILGSPSEQPEDQWKTIEMIKDLAPQAKARLHYFMPLPGTPWANKEPVPLDNGIESKIGQLSTKGIVVGSFTKQHSQTRKK